MRSSHSIGNNLYSLVMLSDSINLWSFHSMPKNMSAAYVCTMKWDFGYYINLYSCIICIYHWTFINCVQAHNGHVKWYYSGATYKQNNRMQFLLPNTRIPFDLIIGAQLVRPGLRLGNPKQFFFKDIWSDFLRSYNYRLYKITWLGVCKRNALRIYLLASVDASYRTSSDPLCRRTLKACLLAPQHKSWCNIRIYKANLYW